MKAWTMSILNTLTMMDMTIENKIRYSIRQKPTCIKACRMFVLVKWMPTFNATEYTTNTDAYNIQSHRRNSEVRARTR